ncbi:hypothetical protein D1AOALGA4SA_10623 [Olavius algarvensis Delta 1 endosymbiont]|nr:hypothetical protein D1AOALGA4SA_10623 [Olavius algarvensis Delta 1 endosymbiont]
MSPAFCPHIEWFQHEVVNICKICSYKFTRFYSYLVTSYNLGF